MVDLDRGEDLVNGRTSDARASVIKALESEGIKGELPRIGAGAGVMVATEGKDVHLPAGIVRRVRSDDTVTLVR